MARYMPTCDMIPDPSAASLDTQKQTDREIEEKGRK